MTFLWGFARRMPLLLCLLGPFSIFLTYGIAVANKHVSAFWPYISDTGTIPPESCIFGLLFSTIAFLMCLIIYVRYREVSEYAKLYPSVGIKPFWNRLAACFGFVSSLGLHMVANFQETNEFTTHIVGAMMCFFSAAFYFFFQTVFTRKMRPEAKVMFWLRVTFTFLNVLFIAGTFAPLKAAFNEFQDMTRHSAFRGWSVERSEKSKTSHPRGSINVVVKANCGNVLLWSVNDKGFVYHAISTFSEWFLVLSFCAYICTIFWDFRKIRIEPPRIEFLDLKERNCREGTEDTEDATEDAGENGAKTLWI